MMGVCVVSMATSVMLFLGVHWQRKAFLVPWLAVHLYILVPTLLLFIISIYEAQTATQIYAPINFVAYTVCWIPVIIYFNRMKKIRLYTRLSKSKDGH